MQKSPKKAKIQPNFRRVFSIIYIRNNIRFQPGTATYIYTIFIRMVATATINFSLAWVQLLSEGGSYWRVVFINFGLILDGVIHKNCSTEDWFTKTALRVTEIRSSKKLQLCSRTKPALFSAMNLP